MIFGDNMARMTENKRELILHEKNILKGIVILAMPVFLSNILKSLHDLVDTYFIGQLPEHISEPGLVAVAINWPVLFVFLSFSIGLSIAGVAIMSQLVGANKEREASKYGAQLLLLSITLGIILGGLVFLFTPLINQAMGARGDVLLAANKYLRIRSLEMVPLFMFVTYQALRQSSGDTITPVILNVIAVIINIILTPIFIRGFGMGVEGAALATLIGQTVILPAALYLMFHNKKGVYIRLSDLKPDVAISKEIVKMAIPSASSQAITSFGFVVLQSIILSYGTQVSAAFSLGNRISSLILHPVMAIGSILAAYVGQNIGARNKERARESYRVARNLSVITMIVGISIILPLRGYITGFLVNSSEVVRLSNEYLVWLLLGMPLMAIFQNYIGVFNGSGNTRMSFKLSVARLWVIRVPLVIIAREMGMDHSSIWYAMLISNILILFYGVYLFKQVDFEPKVRSGKNGPLEGSTA